MHPASKHPNRLCCQHPGSAGFCIAPLHPCTRCVHTHAAPLGMRAHARTPCARTPPHACVRAYAHARMGGAGGVCVFISLFAFRVILNPCGISICVISTKRKKAKKPGFFFSPFISPPNKVFALPPNGVFVLFLTIANMHPASKHPNRLCCQHPGSAGFCIAPLHPCTDACEARPHPWAGVHKHAHRAYALPPKRAVRASHTHAWGVWGELMLKFPFLLFAERKPLKTKGLRRFQKGK